MVAEFFRNAGWRVSVSAGGGSGEASPAALAQAQHFDAVGLSIGTEVQLDWLAEQIAALRKLSRNRRLLVMLGGPLVALQPERLQALGADLCLSSARDAAKRAAAAVQDRLIGA